MGHPLTSTNIVQIGYNFHRSQSLDFTGYREIMAMTHLLHSCTEGDVIAKSDAILCAVTISRRFQNFGFVLAFWKSVKPTPYFKGTETANFQVKELVWVTPVLKPGILCLRDSKHF